jgi:hypothetical protein
MLAGLSKWESLRIPPCFWANVGAAADMVISITLTTTSGRMCFFISVPPLFIEPPGLCSVGFVKQKPRAATTSQPYCARSGRLAS